MAGRADKLGRLATLSRVAQQRFGQFLEKKIEN
jgi:hypothetical protein